MRSEHFETYQQGSVWWCANLEPSGWHKREVSGTTEAEALLAMCEQLMEAREVELANSYWDPES